MIPQQSNEYPLSNPHQSPKSSRGLQVYSLSEIQNVTGRDKDGRLVSWGMESPYFYLTVDQRIELTRLSSPVFGVVSSRMQRLSGLPFSIVNERFKEDQLAQELKDKRSVYREFADSQELEHLVLKARVYQELQYRLPELKPDLSNFDSALVRWKRRLQSRAQDSAQEAEDWLAEPNQGTTWEEFVKKYVFDMMVHGNSAVYKYAEDNDRLVNFDTLPGGTVYKIKSPYFSTISGYVQVVPGYTTPEIFWGDEVAYSEYLPYSGRSHGFIPLEALINKVTETLLFDRMMAEQADGTKPPEKMVIVTEQNPFGALQPDQTQDVPLDKGEQKRIEQKLQEPTKNAIMTFSGNHAEVVDLSRADTMSAQAQRQKDIREEVALVFNMSNMEVNLTGSDDTSGRSTSVAQQEIEQGKGIAPIAKSLMNMVNRQILPYRFGPGLSFEFELSKDEIKERQLNKLKLETGELTPNEIREKNGQEPFGEEYDKPIIGGGQQQPGQDEMNPMFTRALDG